MRPGARLCIRVAATALSLPMPAKVSSSPRSHLPTIAIPRESRGSLPTPRRRRRKVDLASAKSPQQACSLHIYRCACVPPQARPSVGRSSNAKRLLISPPSQLLSSPSLQNFRVTGSASLIKPKLKTRVIHHRVNGSEFERKKERSETGI